ncbi:MAG: mycothiol conjugate amidase Mca [Actinobacteria bacterium]|nr:mycothiol conjugate amidase Mca [Actinomycetota bacterium]
MTRCLLFVHAHPDDESSKGAATAARYADAGTRVVLVTCTDGGAGEVLNDKHPPVAPEDMVDKRRQELADAVGILGFSATYQLGFPDSGYHEDPSGIPEDAFARTPVDEAATPLADVLRRERPDVVVTYPDDSGYPHPDHIMVHTVTMRAVELARDDDGEVLGHAVPKLYSSGGFSAERVHSLHEAMLARELDSPYEGWLERRADRPARDCDARIEVGEYLALRDEALLAHATQIDPDGWWFAVPRDLEREVFPYECFTLLHSEVPVSLPEHDLFAGLE